MIIFMVSEFLFIYFLDIFNDVSKATSFLFLLQSIKVIESCLNSAKDNVRSREKIKGDYSKFL